MYCKFDVLTGKTLCQVIVSGNGYETSEKIEFITDTDERYVMYHHQECCEHVYIEDINGDLSDLIGSPITTAYKGSNDDPNNPDACWTFYNIATEKGWVTIRWYGSSNGNYSIGVDFKKIK